MVARVEITEKATAMVERLKGQHGPLMFHQSGGCCDGSSPMCYPVGMFRIGASDVHLGDLDIAGIDPVAVHMSASQYQLWRFTHITIDLVDGRGSGFSVEAPEGKRFLIRSRMLTDAEVQELEIAPHFAVGAQPLLH